MKTMSSKPLQSKIFGGRPFGLPLWNFRGIVEENDGLERRMHGRRRVGVKKVKSAEDLTICDVVTITPESTISEVQAKMNDELISGLPEKFFCSGIVGNSQSCFCLNHLRSPPYLTFSTMLTSLHLLSLLRGLVSIILTLSPILH